jgi:hypothetical protein
MSTQDDRVPTAVAHPAVQQKDKSSSTADHSKTFSSTELAPSDLPDRDDSSCGSLDLGKQRQQDAPLNIDPEKHVTQRATTKEFHFPKSN